MSFSGGKGRSKGSERIEIPGFLQPLLQQGATAGQRALGEIERLTNANRVAPFSGAQLQAHKLARERALGSDIFSTATDAFLDTARGLDLDAILPPESLAALRRSAGGGLGFVPPQALSTLTDVTRGADVPTASLEALTAGAIPESVTRRLSGAQQLGEFIPSGALDTLTTAGSAVDPFVAASGIVPETLDTLRSAAAGENLFGGEAFNAAVDAAVRAARPQIQSVFGRAGPGAATGGLAQEAIGRAAVDAFASQFGRERQNQLEAARALSSLNLADIGQRGGFALAGGEQGLRGASTLAGLAEAERARDIASASDLARLGLSDAARRGDVSRVLAELGLSETGLEIDAATRLAALGSDAAGRGLSAAGLLADLGNIERDRQLTAAAALPDISTADINLLRDIGAEQQEQQQRIIDNPLLAQLQFLSAALGGLPISSLLGRDTRGRTAQIGFDTRE